MSDRLYFSCWIRGFDAGNMLAHFGNVLEAFPISKLARKGPVLRIYAIEFSEPPLAEQPFDVEATVEAVTGAAQEFLAPDCCCELEATWDLWQHDGEWAVAPSPVRITCFGPEFDNEDGDHLRLDFGLDAQFLPSAGLESSLRMQQSNLRSLVHLLGEIERVLPVERRQLWSESGANFADLLAGAVDAFGSDA